MNQATDFEKLRKKRRRSLLIRRLLVLAGLFVAVLGVMTLNSLILNVETLTGLNDFVKGLGGGGYPIAVPGGILRDVKPIGSDLAVLNDTNLYVYNAKGKEVLSLQGMGDNTVMVVGGGRVLAFDTGGMHYRIYSRSQELLDAQAKYGILNAALGAGGDFALVTSSKQYVAQVTVYNERFEQIFEWLSSELVVGVSVSPDGGYMAACCVGAQGGVLHSSVHLFDFALDSPLAVVEFDNELVLQVEYLQKGIVGVLTERRYLLLDETGGISASYEFASRSLVQQQRGGAGLLLILADADGRAREAVLLDDGLRELGSVVTDYKISGAAVGKKYVWLLGDGGIETYSPAMEVQERLDMAGVGRIAAVDNTLYYFTKEEIHTLG